MILNAYSLFDNKGLIFNTPFFQHNDAVAKRMLQDLVQDLNTSVGRHPSDYVLYCIGTYDDQTGELHPISPRRHVADAISMLRVPPPELFPGNPSPSSLTPLKPKLKSDGELLAS